MLPSPVLWYMLVSSLEVCRNLGPDTELPCKDVLHTVLVVLSSRTSSFLYGHLACSLADFATLSRWFLLLDLRGTCQESHPTDQSLRTNFRLFLGYSPEAWLGWLGGECEAAITARSRAPPGTKPNR